MAASLLALLDDIASVLDDVALMTKVAARKSAAAVDDVAVLTKLSAQKTAGVLGDDLALNAQQVAGVRADRELPVVWGVAKGSLVNKAILVPAALAISALAPWLVTPLLMAGGAFLCFEGAEKLAHRFLGGHEKEHEAAPGADARAETDLAALEKAKVKGASTVMFQTVTGNRILTPSVLGLDALYALIQALMLIALGAAGAALPDLGVFALTVAVMIGAGAGLTALVLRGRRSATTLVLLGIVLGTFLRANTTFIQRLLDPNLVLQNRLFASFNSVDTRLLVASLALTALASLASVRDLRALDVVALGPDTATALGVDHRRVSRRIIALVTVLVSVSTALVGPILFLGLLVAHLAYWAARTDRHVVTVPMAALVAMVVLVGGQTLLAHALGNETVLSVVIEFLGGLALIVLLIRSGRRS